MTMKSSTEPGGRFETREERRIPKKGVVLSVEFRSARDGSRYQGILVNVSKSGFHCLLVQPDLALREGDDLGDLQITTVGLDMSLSSGVIRHMEQTPVEESQAGITRLGVEVLDPDVDLRDGLQDFLQQERYVTSELKEESLNGISSTLVCEQHTLVDFYRLDSEDLFAKCDHFYEVIKDMLRKRFFQSQYRVTLTSGLDNRICVFNPITRQEQEMICFDSNSYLGLHKHPRVLEAVKKALDQAGYGTPSAQLLCGTNRYLRELEQTISDYYGREETIVFSSGYATNLGCISALVRENDLVVRDRFSHASVHDGCRFNRSQFSKIYRHNDMEDLRRILSEYADRTQGKLIVTDGVFSMHGRVAKLDALVEIAREFGAKLMVDEAHSLGVIGRTGRGIEELFDLEGRIDILMGTFSKAPGCAGGYVTGARELITYLRFYARSNMFSAALPAHICAGIAESFRIIEDEPWHREKLWENVHYFVPRLREMGYITPDPESAIVTLLVGSNKLLWAMSRDLFQSGIKCGNVSYPAVPLDEGIIRMTLNARHTRKDLDETLDILHRTGEQYGMLGKSPEELKEWENWFSPS
jgi:glycine C-acetyltransferase